MMFNSGGRRNYQRPKIQNHVKILLYHLAEMFLTNMKLLEQYSYKLNILKVPNNTYYLADSAKLINPTIIPGCLHLKIT